MSLLVQILLIKPSDEALEVFKELFLQACPKYLNVNPPPYEDEAALSEWNAHPPQDATQRHLELFLSDVIAVKGVPSVRNLLKLYTSIDAAKLSAFMQTADDDGEEDVLQHLMVLKAASRTYAKGQGDGSLLDGDRIVTNNLDFTIDGVRSLSLMTLFPLMPPVVHGSCRGDNIPPEICRIFHSVSISHPLQSRADWESGTPSTLNEYLTRSEPQPYPCSNDLDYHSFHKHR